MGIDAQLEDLHRYQESDRFSDLEKDVIEYAERLTGNPADIPDELFARLSNHLDDGQLVELTAMIAWENFVGRFNRGFDLQAQGYADASSRLQREQGDPSS